MAPILWELAAIEKAHTFFQNTSTQKSLQDYSSQHNTEWVFSPSRALHFGGLWEAAVKAMKRLMRKVIGEHALYPYELETVLVEIEGTLNSRPIAPLPCSPEDGVLPLTAGHFLVGRPLNAPPEQLDLSTNPRGLKRWNLVNRISADLWVRWRREYLQHLQTRTKWYKPQTNFQVGDVVLLKETELWKRDWPLGRVVKTYPGSDGLVHVVDLRINGKTYNRPITKLVHLLTDEDH